MVTFPPAHNTYPDGRHTRGDNYQVAISLSRERRGLGPKRHSYRPVVPVINKNRSKKSLSNAHERAIVMEKEAQGKRPRSMHSGGLVRKSGPHRLLKGEIVLSRSQRQGFTHGQILKILSLLKDL